MVMMNDMDRFHLVIDVIDHVPSLQSRAALLRQQMVDARAAARRWTREYGDDIPAVRDWTWTAATDTVDGSATVLPAGALSDTSADFSPADAVPQT
jgi:xylulose-5-phosphate/fructose-6-phosphate phosphoketolase